MKNDVKELKVAKAKKKKLVEEIEAEIEEEEKAEREANAAATVAMADVDPAGFCQSDKASAFELIHLCEERGTTVTSLAQTMGITDVPLLRRMLVSMEADGNVVYQRALRSDAEKVWSKTHVEDCNDSNSVDGSAALHPSNSAVAASLANEEY